MEDIRKFLDELVDDSERLIKDQLIELLIKSKSDSEELIQKLGELTEKYIKQRANREISKSEFEELMEDVLDLDDMQYNKLSVQAKVSVDKIRDGFQDLVMNRLMALL